MNSLLENVFFNIFYCFPLIFTNRIRKEIRKFQLSIFVQLKTNKRETSGSRSRLDSMTISKTVFGNLADEKRTSREKRNSPSRKITLYSVRTFLWFTSPPRTPVGRRKCIFPSEFAWPSNTILSYNTYYRHGRARARVFGRMLLRRRRRNFPVAATWHGSLMTDQSGDAAAAAAVPLCPFKAALTFAALDYSICRRSSLSPSDGGARGG